MLDVVVVGIVNRGAIAYVEGCPWFYSGIQACWSLLEDTECFWISRSRCGVIEVD